MNRYRTVPGLGPSASKATSTTTCQKCLKKGHYSYECKASVQSRPYISRPSRSQQLQNPKLKPALAEQKMEMPETILGEAKTSAKHQETTHDERSAVAEEVFQERASRKRPRSSSSSSNSSIATISTDVSQTGARGSRPSRSKRRDTRSRSISRSRSGSMSESLEKDVSSHRRDDRNADRSGSRARSRSSEGQNTFGPETTRSPARPNTQRHERGSRGRGDRHGFDRQDKPRRWREPDELHNSRQLHNDGSNRGQPRSLSPYSRRLALTQAMNAGSR